MVDQAAIFPVHPSPTARLLGGASGSAPEYTSVLVGCHGLVVLKHAHGVLLTLRSGRIWITVERDPADYILSAGQQMGIVSRRPAVLEAWRKSWIEFAAPRGSRFEIARVRGSLCLLDLPDEQAWPETAARR